MRSRSDLDGRNRLGPLVSDIQEKMTNHLSQLKTNFRSIHKENSSISALDRDTPIKKEDSIRMNSREFNPRDIFKEQIIHREKSEYSMNTSSKIDPEYVKLTRAIKNQREDYEKEFSSLRSRIKSNNKVLASLKAQLL